MRIRAQNYNKGIFALEGNWLTDLRDTSSVNASLIFLQQNCGIKYIYKQCNNFDGLKEYLKLWKQKKYKAYSILYLAFHGLPGSIYVGKEHITLEQLGDILEGKCQNKIIHFGSCKTLSLPDEEINLFLERTGALTVCGFESKIDFVESSAFDLILLEKFQQFKDISSFEKSLIKDYRGLIRKLQFKMVYLNQK